MSKCIGEVLNAIEELREANKLTNESVVYISCFETIHIEGTKAFIDLNGDGPVIQERK
jgi:hypothetical protein